MSDVDTQALLDELYATAPDEQAEAQATAPPTLPAGDYHIQVDKVTPVRNADDANWAPGHPFALLGAAATPAGSSEQRRLSFRVTPVKLMAQRQDGGQFPAGAYRLFAQMRDALKVAKDAPAGDVFAAALRYPLYARVSLKAGKDGVERNNVERIGAVR